MFSNGLQNQHVKYIAKRVNSTISNAEFYVRYNELVIMYIFTAIILAASISSQFKYEIRFILIKNVNLNLERYQT